MIKAVIFDMDDTLYDERDFFVSGFTVVAIELESRGCGQVDSTIAMLEAIHHLEGRQGVFQKVSERLPFPSQWIPELVELFRNHTPNIKIGNEVPVVLRRLKQKYKIGCVTDGWADVQRGKLRALGIEPMLDAIVISDELGHEFWKPHPLPFLTCCQRLKIEPNQAIFVGDHPERDILGPRNAGMRCIRIRRKFGYFAAIEAEGRPQADHEIESLDQLEAVISELEFKP